MDPGCTGKHYLLWASHTFPGRFTAWCPVKKRTANCSLSDVNRCSTAAAYWLKGFLAGNEPEPPRGEAGVFLDSSHPKFKAWERVARRFQKTGSWPSGL
jgi:hypothetical protein